MRQQILGSNSPAGKSTTRIPPMAVFAVTRPYAKNSEIFKISEFWIQPAYALGLVTTVGRLSLE